MTIALTLAARTSPVVNAIQTAQQMKTAASQTRDPRLKTLAAATAALAVNNAYDAKGKSRRKITGSGLST